MLRSSSQWKVAVGFALTKDKADLRFAVDANYLFGGRLTGGELRYSLSRHGAANYPRAYQAFHTKIVSGVLAQHRNTLVRAYKASLPDLGKPFPNAEAERRAFLVFLHYARLSVLGQCGQRVDANWASQSAILQSIARFHPVDLVILIAYGVMEDAQARSYRPRVVFVDRDNRQLELGHDPAHVPAGTPGLVSPRGLG